MAKAEKQINEQNEKFKKGESSFYEQLNEDSDVPRDLFAKEKEGAKIPRTPQGRSLGAILPPESEWYTSPELEELYASRQTPPASYDATAKGKLNIVQLALKTLKETKIQIILAKIYTVYIFFSFLMIITYFYGK